MIRTYGPCSACMDALRVGAEAMAAAQARQRKVEAAKLRLDPEYQQKGSGKWQ